LLAAFIASDPIVDKVVKHRIPVYSTAFKLCIYSIMLASIILFGYFGEVEFIYFQF
jgi:hypothetical protein